MVIKIIEVIGVSTDSFEDAIRQAVARTSKTLKGITGVDVIGQNAQVKDGKVIEFRVNLKVAFVVND